MSVRFASVVDKVLDAICDSSGHEMVSAKAKVLIVDDDELIRTTERLILEAGNFEVVTAGTDQHISNPAK
jgi:PleD family two-component response regulator